MAGETVLLNTDLPWSPMPCKTESLLGEVNAQRMDTGSVVYGRLHGDTPFS